MYEAMIRNKIIIKTKVLCCSKNAANIRHPITIDIGQLTAFTPYFSSKNLLYLIGKIKQIPKIPAMHNK